MIILNYYNFTIFLLKTKMGELDKLLRFTQKNLFPLPKIAKQILDILLLKPEKKLVDFVSQNDELSSFILSIANHPMYRKENPPVKDLNLALLILGEDSAKILILGFLSAKICKTTFNEFNFRLFWARALANLCFSFALASQLNTYPPHLHISSYLMDFGIIILYLLFPEGYLKVLKLKHLGKSICEAEKEVFGVDHAIIGSEYFELYNLPRRFILDIQYHHQFPEIPEELPPEIWEDLKTLNFIDLAVRVYFNVDKDRKFKEFKNFGYTYFNFNSSQIDFLIDSLPEWVNPFYEFLGYKEFYLEPYSKWIVIKKEKIKEEIKRLQEQKKQEETLIEFYQEELTKKTQEKLLLLEKIEELTTKLKISSFLDPLTNLYNEEYFLRRLKEELLRAKRYRRILSILLIEIEKLTQITELYGTKEEENILKVLSQNILKNLRRVDIVAKLSKNEQFAIILPETPLSGALVAARRLLRIIENTFQERYRTIYSPYISLISYDPSKLDPKKEPKVEEILNVLNNGLSVLKARQQKRIISLVIDTELETKQI